MTAVHMTAELLRIDPALPICWEDPDTLRIGFEHAAARVPRPSAGVQRLISALCDGLTLEQTPSSLRRFGATPRDWRDLIEQVASVLVTTGPGGAEPKRAEPSTAGGRPAVFSPRPGPHRIAVAGNGLGAQHLRDALERSGREVTTDLNCPADRPDPDLLIVVERFLEPRDHPRLILSERVPHLVVGFTDRTVRIGPLTVPNTSPCPECVTQHEIDADPKKPVIAAQLFGQTPAAETPAAVRMSVALILGVIERWQHGGRELSHAQIRLTVNDGLPSLLPEMHEVQPHPACPCFAFATLRVQDPTTSPASPTKRDGVR